MSTTTLAPLQLRKILAHVPTSITFIGGLDEEHQPAGMIVASFVGLSLDPPLLGVSIQNSSSTWPRLRDLTHLGISVLTWDHATAVPTLAGPSASRFDPVDWSVRGTAVHLADASVHFTVRLREEIPAGDHLFAVLEVVEAEEKPAGSPLVFHASAFKHL